MPFEGRTETTMFADYSMFVCYLLVSIRRQKSTAAYSTNDLLFYLLFNLRQRFLCFGQIGVTQARVNLDGAAGE